MAQKKSINGGSDPAPADHGPDQNRRGPGAATANARRLAATAPARAGEEERLGEDGDALALRPRSRLGFCGTEEQLVDIFFFLPENSIPGRVEGMRGARGVRESCSLVLVN